MRNLVALYVNGSRLPVGSVVVGACNKREREKGKAQPLHMLDSEALRPRLTKPETQPPRQAPPWSFCCPQRLIHPRKCEAWLPEWRMKIGEAFLGARSAGSAMLLMQLTSILDNLDGALRFLYVGVRFKRLEKGHHPVKDRSTQQVAWPKMYPRPKGRELLSYSKGHRTDEAREGAQQHRPCGA
ncbi:hypothetical protein NC651_022426 [Populus alba x Populus x berolinensis]|nr:hypothetical protein NC651_022426 [Populus alba x Populus x berolinensis]